MAVYNPIITTQGKAAVFNANATGTQLVLTHMAYGTAAYDPKGDEVALKAEVKRIAISAGSRIAENQIRIATIWPQSDEKAEVNEIGFYAGNVLFAVISRKDGGPYLVKSAGANLIFSYDWVINAVPSTSITIKVDPDALALLVHMADANAHPQYLTIAEYQTRDFKDSVRVATTANVVTLAGLLVIDGVQLKAGDRVLVRAQNSAFLNGIYVVAAGAWYRAADANHSTKVTPSLTVAVEEGTANADTQWTLTTNAPITLGTTNLAFDVVGGPSGAAAGTYTMVSVDARGRVTSGSNPSTLATMGILDAFTKAQTTAGFVKQGGGIGMGTNAVMLGWNGQQLLAQVDQTTMGNLWYSGNFQPASKQDRLEMVAAIAGFPLASAPIGWLKANGAAVSRTAYADLFARIGTTFGAGDGSTTFNLPDYRGEFLRGFDDGRGLDSGRTLNSVQAPMLLTHNHSASADAQGSHAHNASATIGGGHTHTGSATDAGWHGHTGATSEAGWHAHLGTAADNGWHSHSGVTGAGGEHTHSIPTNNNINYSPGAIAAGGPSAGLQPGSTNGAGNHQHGLAIDASGTHQHELAIAANGTHAHAVDVWGGGNHAHNLAINAVGHHGHEISVAAIGAHAHNITVNSTGGAENRPRNMSVLFCIKY